MDAADLARDQKEAQQRGQTIAFVDESDFYRLPSVVRTWAPAGQTPVLRGPLRRLLLLAVAGLVHVAHSARAVMDGDASAALSLTHAAMERLDEAGNHRNGCAAR